MLSCVAKKLGGKAIWLSLLVAVMFSLSYAPQAKAQQSDPIPIDPIQPCYSVPCTNPIINGHGIPVHHPLFPNCFVDVQVLVYTCPDGSRYYEIIQITLINSAVDCPALKSWLLADRTRIGQIYDLAIDFAATVDFINLMAIGDTAFCPAAKKVYTSYQVKCNTFCFYEDTQNAKMIVIPKKCNSTGCCKIEHALCWDDVNKKIVDTKTVTALGTDGQCTPSITPCAPFITQKNLTGSGTHQVPLDWTEDCVPTSACQQ
ncbi:MAG: hypothetical protein JST20_07140 [Bacteroidetes bacterium]|nr:hypothetical protein [Bacteroidota bacterium]